MEVLFCFLSKGASTRLNSCAVPEWTVSTILRERKRHHVLVDNEDISFRAPRIKNRLVNQY